MIIPEKKLKNGRDIPILGFSTRNITKKNALSVLKTAIDSGCRHFVTASCHQNDKVIGTTLKRVLLTGSLKRKDLYLTHKINPKETDSNELSKSVRQAIADLQSDYLDLCLLEDPGISESGMLAIGSEKDGAIEVDCEFVSMWKELEKLHEEGLVRAVGVSNFKERDIRKILQECTLQPVVHHMNVEALEESVIRFCTEHSIEVAIHLRAVNQSSDVIKAKDASYGNVIAMKYGRTSIQIVIRAYIERGFILIIESKKLAEIRNEFQVFDFEILPEEVARIMKREESQRHDNPPFRSASFKSSREVAKHTH